MRGGEPCRLPLERKQRRTSEALVGGRHPKRVPLGRSAPTAMQRLALPAESRVQLSDVGNDETCRVCRRRRARVRGEIAERRVLLVADRRDDGDGRPGDRAHDALVRERQQILEASAAAREHEHVGAAARRARRSRAAIAAAARGPCT